MKQENIENNQVNLCPLCGEKTNKFTFCNVCYTSALQEAYSRKQGRSVSLVLKKRMEIESMRYV